MYQVITDADFRRAAKTLFSDMPRVFLFFGEEDYLKHNAVAVARDVLLSPDAVSFDFAGISQASAGPGAIEAALAAPPMFGMRKVVAVTLSFTDLKPSETSAVCDLLSALDADDPNYVLINVPNGGIDPGYPKKPSALLRRISEFAQPVRFDRVAPNRLSAWAAKHYRAAGVSASGGVCDFTVNYIGQDMFRLSSEIDKISFYVLSRFRSDVTEDDVRLCGSPLTEFDGFALSNAIVAGQHRRALEVMSFLRAGRIEPVRIMSEIIRTVCDMKAVKSCRKSGMTAQQICETTGISPYPLNRYSAAVEKIPEAALDRALELAREADESVKGYGNGYVAIEKFICSM